MFSYNVLRFGIHSKFLFNDVMTFKCVIMYFKFAILFGFKVQIICTVKLDLINCGIDDNTEVVVGKVELDQYPWLGVFYYTYHGDVGETRAVTTVALIQKEFVIAAAADIGPLPKEDFRANSRILLGEGWQTGGRQVRSYVIHPEYNETINTLALIQLKKPIDLHVIPPLCPAPDRLRNPIFYVIKFKEDFNNLQKQVLRVEHVPARLCKEFYDQVIVQSTRLMPPRVVCTIHMESKWPCAWEAGAALVSRDVWGRWQLLGLGVRGPGCGAPARFLDLMSYGPWIQKALASFQRVTISRISSKKYVLRSDGGDDGGTSIYQRFGNCDEEEKKNLIYRESIVLRTDNLVYQFMTYNLTLVDQVEFTCLTLELVNSSGVSEMRIKHYCPRVAYGPPCHFYRGSVFDLSVHLMFSDRCMFEMFAWGYPKSLSLIDIQKWKWEEGVEYEDFYPQKVEYRGPTYMTEFGFEPVDRKLWVPDFDIWTTTVIDNSSWSSTTPLPDKEMSGPEGSYNEWYYYQPTKGTTTLPPPTKKKKKKPKRKSTTTSTTTENPNSG